VARINQMNLKQFLETIKSFETKEAIELK